MKVLFTTITVLLSSVMLAQSISGVVDFRNRFWSFNNGQTMQLDHLQIRDFQMSYNHIAYIRANNDFCIYHNGTSTKVREGITSFKSTDYLMTFRNFNGLSVYENGKVINLSTNAPISGVGDSLVVYYDDYAKKLMAYYNSEQIELEPSLIRAVSGMQVGENIAAYTDAQNYFKVFYRGQLTSLMNTAGSDVHFKLGRNTLAYFNEPNNTFDAIIEGDETELEDQEPTSYKCGDNLIAYINQMDEFVAFDGVEKHQVSSYNPDFYYVVDNMIVYGLQDYFYAFVDGENFELENFIPGNHMMERNSVAYLDQQGRLIWFKDKEKKVVSAENVTRFKLYGDVLTYQIGENQNFIRWNGKDYSL